MQVKSRIGFLPEETYLYRFLNANETLDYYGRIFKIPRQERRHRIEMLLEMVGLSAGARAAYRGVFQGHGPAHRPGPGPHQTTRTC